MLMIQVRKQNDLTLNIQLDNNIHTDLGWQETVDSVVEEKRDIVINPTVNYETKRLMHQPYITTVDGLSIEQCDIWFDFYFLKEGLSYVQEYTPIGLTLDENARHLREVDKSFFKLEFYKTRNGELPNRHNRKLIFSKVLSIPLGERYFYEVMNVFLFRPTFTGNNTRNTENMYLYWYDDETNILDEEYATSEIWMTAKFYNSDDGMIYDFTNKPTSVVSEEHDLYYKVHITNNFYTVHNDVSFTRVGTLHNPIRFYQKKQ